MNTVYELLRERLDKLSVGFPSTDTGIELKILKRLFTEEEAGLFIKLSPMLESPEVVAERLGLEPDKTADIMEKMSKKGLLFRQKKDDKSRYSVVPYVIGIFEHQVNNVSEDFAREHEEYFEKAYGKVINFSTTPLLRTIPVNSQIVVKWPIAPYEDAIKIIENQETIALAPCICRKTKQAIGEGCDKPIEKCLIFGSMAKYYAENNMGRLIDREEAKELIRQNDKEGLVIQPLNAQKINGMCSCCGDCCGLLRSLKMRDKPMEAVQSNYYAVISDECIGCETCLDRCQMDAIKMVNGQARVILERCIGCGLCVTTCEAGAAKLIKKDENQLYTPPKSPIDTIINIAMERGKNPMPE